MLRFALRFLGLILSACGFVALVVDASRSLASDRLIVTPAEQTLSLLLPGWLGMFQALVEQRVHPVAWDPVIVGILHLPSFFVLGVIAILSFWLARPPRPKFGFLIR